MRCNYGCGSLTTLGRLQGGALLPASRSQPHDRPNAETRNDANRDAPRHASAIPRFCVQSVQISAADAHPFSEAIALDYATLLHVFQGESRAALERGREAVGPCSRHGFKYYLAMGNVLAGRAKAAEGEWAPA